MSVTLWEVWAYHLVSLIGRSICSKKVIEDFWDVNISSVTIEGRFIDSNMNGFSIFSSHLFAIFVYYLEVRDVGLGWLLEPMYF